MILYHFLCQSVCKDRRHVLDDAVLKVREDADIEDSLHITVPTYNLWFHTMTSQDSQQILSSTFNYN